MMICFLQDWKFYRKSRYCRKNTWNLPVNLLQIFAFRRLKGKLGSKTLLMLGCLAKIKNLKLRHPGPQFPNVPIAGIRHLKCWSRIDAWSTRRNSTSGNDHWELLDQKPKNLIYPVWPSLSPVTCLFKTMEVPLNNVSTCYSCYHREWPSWKSRTILTASTEADAQAKQLAFALHIHRNYKL